MSDFSIHSSNNKGDFKVDSPPRSEYAIDNSFGIGDNILVYNSGDVDTTKSDTYNTISTFPSLPSCINDFEEKHPDLSKYFLELQSQQYELFAEKMLSYGIDNIAMGTQLDNEGDIKLSLTAIWIRMNDKMNRLKNLVLKGNSNPLKNESIMDSWKDLVNYSLIAQLVSMGLWKK
jgi:hypothetical protein